MEFFMTLRPHSQGCLNGASSHVEFLPYMGFPNWPMWDLCGTVGPYPNLIADLHAHHALRWEGLGQADLPGWWEKQGGKRHESRHEAQNKDLTTQRFKNHSGSLSSARFRTKRGGGPIRRGVTEHLFKYDFLIRGKKGQSARFIQQKTGF